MTKRQIAFVGGLAALMGLAGGFLSGLLVARHSSVPANVGTSVGPSPKAPIRYGATAAPDVIAGNVRFVPTTASSIPTGQVGLYQDSGNTLFRIKNLDGTFTELAPGWSQTNSLGTATLQMQSDGRFIEFNPNDTYPKFYMNFGCTPSGDAEPDCVAKECWNCGNGGGLVDPAHWASGISFERHFVGGHPQTETHVTATSTNGDENRFISLEGHEDDNSTTEFLDATTVSVGSCINAQWRDHAQTIPCLPTLAVNPTYTLLRSPSNNRGSLLIDESGAAQTILSNTDGTHTSQLILNPNGEVDLAGTLIRIANTSTGNVTFEDDGTNTNIYDSAQDARLLLNSSQIGIYLNGTPMYFFQAAALFLAQKYVHVQRDTIGDGASPMGTALGALLRNTTPATAIAPVQMSPCIVQTGSAWNTTSGTSKDSSLSMCGHPISGAQEIGRTEWGYSNDQSNYYPVGRIERESNTFTGQDAHFGAQGFQFDNANANGGVGFGTCDATHNRGMVRTVYGGAGVTDLTKQCLKSAAGSYSWVQLATGG